MASIVTGIIGGVQGSSASHNAANAETAGYNLAGSTVTNAAATVDPTLVAAGQAAGTGATTAAANAAAGATTAASNAAGGATAAAGAANDLLNPYVQSGNTAEADLNAGAGPGGYIGQSFSGVDENNDPGYAFRMQQGLQALQRSQAASGVAGGGADKAIERYGQDYASNEYQNAFNRFTTDKQQKYNMESGIAGQGEAAAGASGQNLTGAAAYGGKLETEAAQYGGAAQDQAAQYAGSINTQEANVAGKNTMDAAIYKGNAQIGSGVAQAKGDIGAANAWNGALSAVGNGVDDALAGGFGAGDGSFSLAGAASGVPQTQQSWNV